MRTWGLLSRVRCDYGMENYHVAAYVIQHRGPGRGSIITRSSVHNSRVEGTHRDVYAGVLIFCSRIFEQLKMMASWMFCMISIFLALSMFTFREWINSLEELVRQMNDRPASTERNQSSLQMWERGMLENLHSGHTALSEAEIEHSRVDLNAVLAGDHEDYG